MSHLSVGALFRPQIQLEVDYPANCFRPPGLGCDLRVAGRSIIYRAGGGRRVACNIGGAPEYCNAVVMLHCSIRDAMNWSLNIHAVGSPKAPCGAGSSPEQITVSNRCAGRRFETGRYFLPPDPKEHNHD